MSDHDPLADDGGDPPDDELLAAELVLGVLAAPQRLAAQARSESDPQFARRMAAWEQRFAPWLADVQPVAVPALVWPKIRARLGWDAAAAAPGGLWQSLGFWRGAAALASVAAVVAIWVGRVPQRATQPPVAVIVRATAPEPAAKLVTTLAHDDGSPGWLASVDKIHSTVLMVPVPNPPDSQGRVPELWLIPPGQAPRSLGIVSIDKSHTVAVPQDLQAALNAGSVLAITLEPTGGAPGGAPTGPIIAKGQIRI